MITYCKRCILPSTKPDLSFDRDGVCSACSAFDNRPTIDWEQRREELQAVLNRYRNEDGSNWDCIVPVSGGKDSTYQIIKLLEFGMNPLAVTATTCDLSDIGRSNIENIKSLGVDHIGVSPNPKVRAILNRVGLEQVGDISWPEHVGIFTIPIRVALSYGIPLIVWGENSQNEYGGPATAAENQTLDRRWLEEFGGLLGLRVSDLPYSAGISQRDLLPYQYPTDEQLKSVGVTGIFLGHFIPWDGYQNALISQAYGLRTYEYSVEGSPVNYENLDNYQTGIHDYFKYLKFGFGRTSDILSTHIRRGRIDRSLACQIADERDGSFPWTYLGKSLESVLEPLAISVAKFMTICDEFTNREIFKRDRKGELVRRGDSSPLLETSRDNR